MKLIAFTTTIEQFRDGSQDVTRRKRWLGLKPGTRLMAVDRTSGLPQGDRPVELGEIEVVSVRREALNAITEEDVAREGYPGRDPDWFVTHFVQHHGGSLHQEITRIEFRRVFSRSPVLAAAEQDAKPDAQLSADETPERSCRECGCTDERACPTDPPCHWVEPDLCSACAVGQPDVDEVDVDDVDALERELNRAARAVADESVDSQAAGHLSDAEARYLTLRGLAQANTQEERIAAHLLPYLTDEQIRDVVAGIADLTNPGAARAT